MEENTDVPSFDKMKGDLIKIYPEGDLKETYNRLLFYIGNMMDSKGNPLTYEFLLNKFGQHIKQWNHLYQRKEGAGYLSKDAEKKRKTFYEFLGEGLYENEFSIQKGSLERDAYLFGPFNMAYLEKKLESFNSIFKHVKQDGKTQIE